MIAVDIFISIFTLSPTQHYFEYLRGWLPLFRRALVECRQSMKNSAHAKNAEKFQLLYYLFCDTTNLYVWFHEYSGN